MVNLQIIREMFGGMEKVRIHKSRREYGLIVDVSDFCLWLLYDYYITRRAANSSEFSDFEPMVMRRQLPHIVTRLRLRTMMPCDTR